MLTMHVTEMPTILEPQQLAARLETLRQRYASGEIDQAEYEQAERTLV